MYIRFLLIAGFAIRLLDAATIVSGKLTVFPNAGAGGSITLSDGFQVIGGNEDPMLPLQCNTVSPGDCTFSPPPFLQQGSGMSNPTGNTSHLSFALFPSSVTPLFRIDGEEEMYQLPFTASGIVTGPFDLFGFIHPCPIPGNMDPNACFESVTGAGNVMMTVRFSQGPPAAGFSIYQVTQLDYVFTPIPEPRTLLLVGLGFFWFARRARWTPRLESTTPTKIDLST